MRLFCFNPVLNSHSSDKPRRADPCWLFCSFLSCVFCGGRYYHLADPIDEMARSSQIGYVSLSIEWRMPIHQVAGSHSALTHVYSSGGLCSSLR
jgi:hypothetical protein